MVQIKKRLDNDDHCGCNDPFYLTVHDTGNYTDSDEGNANFFCTGTRDASAHYFVDDDSITQLVEDYNGAYHCGDGGGIYGITNHNSIGIEMCRVEGTTTQTTRDNTIELIAILMKRHNIPISRVVRHYDASRKNCPASLNYNNWQGWTDFKNRLNNYIANGNRFSPTVIEEEIDVLKFSEEWYLTAYSDVANAIKNGYFVNGYDHYIKNGKIEKRLPIPPLPLEYCEGTYRKLNKDIDAAIVNGQFANGVEHYLQFGWKEKRQFTESITTDKYLEDKLKELESANNELKNKIENIKNIVE